MPRIPSKVLGISVLLLPTMVGQHSDVNGTFLLPIIVLAFVGEDKLVLKRVQSETGRKGKTVARQD